MAFSEYDSSCGCDCCANVNKLCSPTLFNAKKFQGNPNIKHWRAIYRGVLKVCAQSIYCLTRQYYLVEIISVCIDIDIVRLLSNWQRSQFIHTLTLCDGLHKQQAPNSYGSNRHTQRWIICFIWKKKLIFVDWNMSKLQTNMSSVLVITHFT